MATMACHAQKPETIVTFVAIEHDAEWYEEQARLWKAEVDKWPQGEWAWRNLFRATNYYEMFTGGHGDDPDKSRTADVIRGMEKAIPDSYVLNLSKQRFCLTTDTLTRTTDKPLKRAIELMPEDAEGDDVSNLATRLWLLDPTSPDVARLMKLTYKKNFHPAPITRYNWNMLMSMEQNAIYFGNGDNCLIPAKMLQDALGVRPDVTIIPMSYLHAPEFRHYIEEKLGINPFEATKDYAEMSEKGEDWAKQYQTDMIMHIVRESGRPAYFFTDALHQANMDKDSLYNEGLLLRYNDKPYDNFAVAMKNVKEIYHMEYLTEPQMTYTQWDACDRMNTNYATVLGHLVKRFKEQGDDKTAEKLYRTLRQSIISSHHDDEFKESMLQYLNEQAGVKAE